MCTRPNILTALLVALGSLTTVSGFTTPSFPATSIERIFSLRAATVTDYQKTIDNSLELLGKAALTKEEDSDLVVQALLDLEARTKEKAKAEGYEVVGQNILNALNGSWRLVFTTGTVKTQERFGQKINYFPIKAVQSFNTTVSPEDPSMKIENGIYAWDTAIIKFKGDFDFDMIKRKLEFDFTEIQLFGGAIQIPLAAGEAAKLGAASGLGSESNVVNAQRKKRAFFNWISANDDIATARGGGGGLALWRRVV